MEQKKLTPIILLIFAAIMVLGTVLQFVNITQDDLWYDESYTAAITNQSFGDIINISGGDNHPPLYYLMLKVILLIFGRSVLVFRAFSVLGVLALAALGIGPVRRTLGTRTGIIFSLLIFIIPITIAMAHEARMYTWAAFFVTGSALYGFLAQRDNRRKDWALFVLFSLAGAYTHYYALLAVIMVCAIMLVFCLKEKKKLAPFLIAAGILIAAYLPWIIKLASQMSRVAGYYWISPVTGNTILSVFVYPFGLKFVDAMHLGLSIPIFALAMVWIIWGFIYRIRKKDAGVKMIIWAFGAYLLTILAGIVASVVIRPVLVERYMVPVLGLFVLAVAYGLASIPRRINMIIAVGVMAVIFVPQVYANITLRVNGPMDKVKSAMSGEVQPDDVFLHVDEITFGTFCYYFPEQTHYYYQREGCEGFSNFDAFKPNGITIDSLEEIEGDPRIWLPQSYTARDKNSVSQWISSGELLVQQTAGNFSLPASWYSFSVMRTAKGNDETLNAAAELEPTGNGTLNVKIGGFRSDAGNAVVLLYNQEPMTGTPYLLAGNSISSEQSEIMFTDLAYGDYSILVYHDENVDDMLDMNGEMPAEGFGYSNVDGPPVGPPDFQFCMFRFDEEALTKSVNVYYFE